ncbi:hypothetical protein DC498_25770 [Terrimonas sp.]|uniref:hypothetical protein n=1 Tax=Terrimonas sp. TaxID=1914338 RepID=UPI000D51A704|nr:hypothetical protein [Terrimonas sp.]PVD49295.1 hypothetical protein DC498_25770 [Terrimonas sp.]
MIYGVWLQLEPDNQSPAAFSEEQDFFVSKTNVKQDEKDIVRSGIRQRFRDKIILSSSSFLSPASPFLPTNIPSSASTSPSEYPLPAIKTHAEFNYSL